MTSTTDYQHLQLEQQEEQMTIVLDRGRANPLGRVLIQELIDVFQEIQESESVQGVVLTGKPGYFSAGLDVLEMYHYDREQMHDFWSSFIELKRTLVSFDKPLVAAVSGHAPAGGCILALCADYRLMAAGPYKIGLNEVPVGIVVPHHIFELYAFCIGRRQAYQNLLEGRLLSVTEAKACGLVNEVLPADELMYHAQHKLSHYLSFDANTWRKSKRNLRAQLIEGTKTYTAEGMQQSLDHWFLPSTRARLKAIVEQLGKKAS